VTLTRAAVVSAARLVRRRWPAVAALDLLELTRTDPAGAILILEAVLYLDAKPLDPETLLPITGDPLDPPARPVRGPGPRSRRVPPEAVRLLRDLGSDKADDLDEQLGLEAAS
jgi:hypothetical protein